MRRIRAALEPLRIFPGTLLKHRVRKWVERELFTKKIKKGLETVTFNVVVEAHRRTGQDVLKLN